MRRRAQDATHNAKAWLQKYFETYADVMPNPSGQMALWHLPANVRKCRYYEFYVQDCAKADLVTVSQNCFCKLWNKDFPHVKIPCRGRFARCNA